MSLTPEQIAQIRQKAGVAPLGAPTAETSLSSKLGLNTPTEPSLTENIGNSFNDAVTKIKSAYNTSQQKMSAAKNPIEAVGAGLEGGLGVASGVASAATAPLTGTVETVMKGASDKTGIHPIDSIAGTETGKALIQKIANLSKDHPELTQNLGDVLNLVATFAGGGSGKAVAPVLKESLKTVTKSIAEKTAKSELEQGAKTIAKQQKDALKALSEDADTLTPTMKKQLVKEGRLIETKNGIGGTKVEILQSPEIKRASELMSDTIKKGDLPTVIYDKVNTKISDLGKIAEKYLDETSMPVTNKEHADIFSKLKKEAETEMTDSELKAYDDQIKLFSKQLVGRGGFNTSNYYKALKKWEANIADKLPRGKEALLDPTGVANAKIRAASDIRTAIRDLIGSKHEEFKPQMYDLMSLYRARDIALQKASKTKSTLLNPKVRKGLKATLPLIGAGIIGSHL